MDSASERRLKFPLKTIEDMKQQLKKENSGCLSGGLTDEGHEKTFLGDVTAFLKFPCSLVSAY